MKWPFVRRSKYEQLLIGFKIINDEKDWHLEHNTQISDENDSYFQEINRLNQDLAKELNSHRETKEQKNELSAECDRLYDEVDNLKKELKETKDALSIAQEDLKETKEHEQKLFEAHDKLNQQNMGLLFENEKLSKQINQLRFDKAHLKTKVKKLESKLVYFDSEYTIMKKNADWFYGNYCRFKDMIEKSGYFPDK